MLLAGRLSSFTFHVTKHHPEARGQGHITHFQVRGRSHIQNGWSESRQISKIYHTLFAGRIYQVLALG